MTWLGGGPLGGGRWGSARVEPSVRVLTDSTLTPGLPAMPARQRSDRQNPDARLERPATPPPPATPLPAARTPTATLLACPSWCRNTAGPRSATPIASGRRRPDRPRARAGPDVVVVVSAMGETTDDLLDKASDITSVPEPRELDMLLTAGERIAMSLLAIAVNARGCRPPPTPARRPDHHRHPDGKARIVEIRPRGSRSPRRRQRRDPRRVPGPVDRVRHHDARPRGLGHHRGRDGGGPGGRRMRDLHRRRRRLHRRPRTHPEARRSTASPTRRCSSSPPPARGSSSCGAWSTLDGTASASTFGTPR